MVFRSELLVPAAVGNGARLCIRDQDLHELIETRPVQRWHHVYGLYVQESLDSLTMRVEEEVVRFRRRHRIDGANHLAHRVPVWRAAPVAVQIDRLLVL